MNSDPSVSSTLLNSDVKEFLQRINEEYERTSNTELGKLCDELFSTVNNQPLPEDTNPNKLNFSW